MEPSFNNMRFYVFFLAFKVPHAKTHVEQQSKFVRELLENNNQSNSDVIGQFYGWLFFACTALLVSYKMLT